MKRLKRQSCILVFIIFCFIISSTNHAGAENDDNDEKVDPVVLEHIKVTATKTTVDRNLAPVAAFSVERKDIEFQPSHYMNNFGELIRDLPGVHVAQYYPWGPPWVQLRGTGHFLQRTVYLIDGIPAHAFMSPVISVEDIEKVDVVLGPSSALYGASAAGGAINIITRSGKAGDGATAKLAYGSNNTFRPSASVGDDNGRFNYRISYSGDYSDGYQMKPIDGMVKLYNLGKNVGVRQASIEDNEYEFNWASGKFGWKGDNGASLDLALNYLNRYLYGGQPNYILHDHGDSLVSSLRLTYPMGNFGLLTASTGYQFQEIPGQDNYGASIVDGKVVVNTDILGSSEWDRERFPFEIQSDFYLGSSNVLTAGVSWATEEENRPRFNAAGQKIYRSDLTTDMLGIYLQDQAFFMDERLSLLGGIRYDEWKYKDIYDSGSSNPTPDSVDKDQFTYRAGAKYKFNDTISVRSSGGTAYWPGNNIWFFSNLNTGPAWREANPKLDPEKTWMVDLGTDLTLADWGTLFQATGYYGIIEDIAAYTPAPHPTVPNTTLTKAENIGEAEIYGIELYLQQPITKHLFFTASLTLNHSRITEDKNNPNNEGNQLRNSPDYWGSLGLRYVNPELVNGEILFRFSDERYYDDNNEDLPYYRMDAYETIDFKIWRDWNLNDHWVLNTGFSVVNLFDDVYPTEWIYVNPGRYIETSVGVRYKF